MLFVCVALLFYCPLWSWQLAVGSQSFSRRSHPLSCGKSNFHNFALRHLPSPVLESEALNHNKTPQGKSVSARYEFRFT